MSVIIQRKRMPLSDLKVKFRIFSKRVSDGYYEFFPAQTPGDFNSSVGRYKAVKWLKFVEKKDKFFALFATLIATPVGWWGVFQNQYDIFAWLFVIWGALGAWILFAKTDENTIDNTEEISNLKTEIREIKKHLKQLQNSK